jgi:hypothetical protein
MTIRLRELTDQSEYTCDWGGCDEVAVAERDAGEPHGWLPVCERHTGRRERRRSPGRGTCPHCGRDYALSLAGLLPLHRRGFDTCPGSRTKPTPPGGGS